VPVQGESSFALYVSGADWLPGAATLDSDGLAPQLGRCCCISQCLACSMIRRSSSEARMAASSSACCCKRCEAALPLTPVQGESSFALYVSGADWLPGAATLDSVAERPSSTCFI
jgi:hypothetical protein